MIVATAGHVDHGKTALVRQLTGVDTDRLEEEKRRGLSIELGYACLPVAGAAPIGIIDVPGHQRFINAMIAGVSGIDLGLLVVALDDGPMPQTLEHLAVLQLLGVERCVLVLSKLDRVARARIPELRRQALAELAARRLAPQAVFEVSCRSGEGIGELKRHLARQAPRQRPRPLGGGFRLSVDRRFTLRGVGLVATGTVSAGRVAPGETLRLLPRELRARVRGLQVHGRAAREARAGQRCALNLGGGLGVADVERGNWLVAAPEARLGARLDVRLRLLPELAFPLRQRSPVRLYLGAGRFSGRIHLLERRHGKQLAAGERALAQLALDEPVSCVSGERFLLRDDSERFTLGGGRVLDPLAPRAGRASPRRLRALACLDRAEPRCALSELVGVVERVDLAWFASACNLPSASLIAGLPPGLALREEGGRQWVVAAAPPRAGEAAALRSESRAPAPDERAARRWRQIEALLRECGPEIPLASQLARRAGLEPRKLDGALQRAVGERKLVAVTATRHALPETLRELAARVLAMRAAGEPVSVVRFKSSMGAGRKLAIEVLEYFDRIGFTRREGDSRQVLDPELPARLLGD